MADKNYKTYSIALGIKYDAEILGKLESVKSKGSYIKELIKKDINGELDNVENFDQDKAKELILQYNNIIKEKYGEKYLNNNQKIVSFQCGFAYSDIIEKLDSVKNRSEYIQNLILLDMGLIDTNGERFMSVEIDGELRTKERKSDEKKLETQKEYRKRTGDAKDKTLYTMQTVRFKNEEIQEINTFCSQSNIKRNTLIRQAVMAYIGKSIQK